MLAQIPQYDTWDILGLENKRPFQQSQTLASSNPQSACFGWRYARQADGAMTLSWSALLWMGNLIKLY